MADGYLYEFAGRAINLYPETPAAGEAIAVEFHEVTDELVTKSTASWIRSSSRASESLTPEERKIMDRYLHLKHWMPELPEVETIDGIWKRNSGRPAGFDGRSGSAPARGS